MRVSLKALPLLLLLSACQPPLGEICADPSFRNFAGLEPVDASPVNADERRVNRDIPSYAGTYPGPDGTLIVRLLEDASDEDIARAQALGEARAPEMNLQHVEVQTTARYTFSELDALWLDSLDFIFTEGVLGHWVSPVHNGVRAYVDNEDEIESVRALWASNGLPPEAFHVEFSENLAYPMPGCPR